MQQKNRLAANAKQSSGSDVIAKSADENDAENLFTDTIIVNAVNTLRKDLVEQKTGAESEVVSEYPSIVCVEYGSTGAENCGSKAAGVQTVAALAYLVPSDVGRADRGSCLRGSTKCKFRQADKVALSGGVFQNRLLLYLTEERLRKEGFEVLRHRMIPPNDGGIAIGQAAYGMHWLQKDI